MCEVTEGLLVAVLGAHLVWLIFVAWQILYVSQYIRRVRRLVIAIAGKMDCDELIDELMSVAEQRQGAGLAEGAPRAAVPAGGTAATPNAPEGQEEERVRKNRERLAAIVAGGQAGQYGLVVRGKAFSADRIDAVDNGEARLGAAMTKTLRSAALQLYEGVVSLFLPIPAENQPGLIADLEGEPFVGHRLAALHANYTIVMACSWQR